MSIKKTLFLFLVTLSLLVSVFIFFDPYTIVPIAFLPIIAIVYLFYYVAIYLFFLLFISNITVSKHKGLMSGILAFTPTIIFALLTLSTLTLIDIALACILPIAAAWYSLRIKT
jgi:hypothetical protein